MLRLSEEEMETLTEHRARLDAELELLQRKKDGIVLDIHRVDDTLNIIDKIIENAEVIYR